jgi:hypothetical protein
MKRVVVLEAEHGVRKQIAIIEFTGIIVEKLNGLEVPIEPRRVKVKPVNAVDQRTVQIIIRQLESGAICGTVGEYEWQSE